MAGFAAALAVPALAENVLIVGGGGGSFPDIQSAVAAAAKDDVILVRAGTYPGFTIDGKSLAVVADRGAIVEIASQVVVRNVSSEKRVILAGLRVISPGPDTTTSFLLGQNVLGSLRLGSCSIGRATPGGWNGASGQHGVSLHGCADVAIVGCTLQGRNGSTGMFPTGGGLGLNIEFSRVVVQDSICTGGTSGSADWPGAPGGPGANSCAAQGSTTILYCFGSTFRGGAGRPGYSATDCFDPPAAEGGPGGDGIRIHGGSPYPAIVLLGTTVAGGAGGLGGTDGCGPTAPNGAPGDPFDLPPPPGASITQLPGSARTATMPVPVREATIQPVTLTGMPGESAYLAWSDQPGFEFVPGYSGVLLVGTPLRPRIRLGTVPASGTLSTKMTFPSLPPGVPAKTYFLQSYFVDSSDAVRLGSAFAQVVLDSPF